MRIKPLHPHFKTPTRNSDGAAAYDLYMPVAGEVDKDNQVKIVGLGFAAEIPKGHVGLILPRSGVGVREGLELNNTCGVIDSDYRGEWKVAVRTKGDKGFRWQKHDRLFQLVIIQHSVFDFEIVDELETTLRGAGGFGSTGS